MPVKDFVLTRTDIATLPSAPEPKTVLCINSEQPQQVALRAIVHDLGWQMRSATTCMDALKVVGSETVHAIFCEAVLADGSWRDILRGAGAAAGAPPLIVTSRLADARLWSEVLNLGGYDVLATPFTAPEVAHVLTNIALSTAPQQYAIAGRG